MTCEPWGVHVDFTVPAVISFSPTRMSFSEKGVEAYLFFFQKCLFLFLVTRLSGWYRSASLRLGTGISLPVFPTCLTKFLVAAANISKEASNEVKSIIQNPAPKMSSPVSLLGLGELKEAHWGVLSAS